MLSNDPAKLSDYIGVRVKKHFIGYGEFEGFVSRVDRKSTEALPIFISWDDGDKGWITFEEFTSIAMQDAAGNLMFKENKRKSRPSPLSSSEPPNKRPTRGSSASDGSEEQDAFTLTSVDNAAAPVATNDTSAAATATDAGTSTIAPSAAQHANVKVETKTPPIKTQNEPADSKMAHHLQQNNCNEIYHASSSPVTGLQHTAVGHQDPATQPHHHPAPSTNLPNPTIPSLPQPTSQPAEDDLHSQSQAGTSRQHHQMVPVLSPPADNIGVGPTAPAAPPKPKLLAKYSQVVVHGGLVYISGQHVSELHTRLGYRGQTLQVLSQLDQLLNSVGVDKQRLLQVRVYLKNMAHGGEEFNKVWLEWVDQEALPARTVVQANLVREGLLVEIEAVAAMDQTAAGDVVPA